jgi:hypothetical protein
MCCFSLQELERQTNYWIACFKRKCAKPNSAYENVVANAHIQTQLLREMKKNAETPGASRYV